MHKSKYHIHHVESQAYGCTFRSLSSTMAAELNIDFTKAKSVDLFMYFAQEQNKPHILNSLRTSNNWKLPMSPYKHLILSQKLYGKCLIVTYFTYTGNAPCIHKYTLNYSFH